MFELSELYFGDLEAFDEAEVHAEFFRKTFVSPTSMSTNQLRNNNKFIVVGRKGSGKTAVQMNLANSLTEKGYLVHFFRFFEDLKPDDYTKITRSQSHISYASTINEKQIFLNYDYRPAWERIFLNRLAFLLKENGFSNRFTKFCAPEKSLLSNVFQGISRTLTIKLQGDMLGIAAEVGVDLSEFKDNTEMPLTTHNAIARSLLLDCANEFQVYFFIDELVFSRLDSKDDEIRVKAAMVRDILRVAKELNNEIAKKGGDIHFICSLRPEIKFVISSLDGEIGKIVDGKDVELSWLISDGEENTILEKVLIAKVENSFLTPISFNTFFCSEIEFSGRKISISEFLKTNTWGRPRDVVRLLQSIQKSSPQAHEIGEEEIKAALDIYSRASTKELLDELGVIYGPKIGSALMKGIKKRTYKDADELWSNIGPHLSGFEKSKVIEELFQLGVIVGFTPNPDRYFSAHRGESYLKPHHKIRIHAALWNEFSIRSQK